MILPSEYIGMPEILLLFERTTSLQNVILVYSPIIIPLIVLLSVITIVGIDGGVPVILINLVNNSTHVLLTLISQNV